MPTDLVGVAFYVLLILPGVMFAISRERHRPRIKQSTFRETATAIFVSTAIAASFGFVVAIASLLSPSVHTEVVRFLDDPALYARERFEAFVIVGFVLLSVAACGAWWLGSKRADELISTRRTEDPNRDSWGYVFNRKPEARNFVGVRLKEGTWVQGYVDTYGNVGEEGMPKALTLIGAISIRPPGGQLEAYEGEVIVVKDAEILYLTVTYMDGEPVPDGAQPRAARPRRTGRFAIIALLLLTVILLGAFRAIV
ncbi:DUF6338 family protein [Microbacterium sp. Kw_RZR3]|uniref:DUF6338 family protein n=1 Tax=Microbacterium sp. Kw_RZR3 TaxID=3032903 RepID=UPI0023DBE055|nr:DUF6338 family protein [Microbacterium sp. Kw_RZR3]MDF2046469.1 DUF6338 family protein [Microbacterium sp. Kw_RZR3]